MFSSTVRQKKHHFIGIVFVFNMWIISLIFHTAEYIIPRNRLLRCTERSVQFFTNYSQFNSHTFEQIGIDNDCWAMSSSDSEVVSIEFNWILQSLNRTCSLRNRMKSKFMWSIHLVTPWKFNMLRRFARNSLATIPLYCELCRMLEVKVFRFFYGFCYSMCQTNAILFIMIETSRYDR